MSVHKFKPGDHLMQAMDHAPHLIALGTVTPDHKVIWKDIVDTYSGHTMKEHGTRFDHKPREIPDDAQLISEHFIHLINSRYAA